MVTITTTSVKSLIPKRVGGKVMASRGGRKPSRGGRKKDRSMSRGMPKTSRGGRKRRK